MPATESKSPNELIVKFHRRTALQFVLASLAAAALLPWKLKSAAPREVLGRMTADGRIQIHKWRGNDWLPTDGYVSPVADHPAAFAGWPGIALPWPAPGKICWAIRVADGQYRIGAAEC